MDDVFDLLNLFGQVPIAAGVIDFNVHTEFFGFIHIPKALHSKVGIARRRQQYGDLQFLLLRETLPRNEQRQNQKRCQQKNTFFLFHNNLLVNAG